ncbi:MAG: hypothetical protein ACRDU8_09715 [Egibacteraceae bacterium]
MANGDYSLSLLDADGEPVPIETTDGEPTGETEATLLLNLDPDAAALRHGVHRRRAEIALSFSPVGAPDIVRYHLTRNGLIAAEFEPGPRAYSYLDNGLKPGRYEYVLTVERSPAAPGLERPTASVEIAVLLRAPKADPPPDGGDGHEDDPGADDPGGDQDGGDQDEGHQDEGDRHKKGDGGSGGKKGDDGRPKSGEEQDKRETTKKSTGSGSTGKDRTTTPTPQSSREVALSGGGNTIGLRSEFSSQGLRTPAPAVAPPSTSTATSAPGLATPDVVAMPQVAPAGPTSQVTVGPTPQTVLTVTPASGAPEGPADPGVALNVAAAILLVTLFIHRKKLFIV